MSARITLGLMSIFDKSAVNMDFLGASIFLPPLRPFLPRGTGAESPKKSNTHKCIVFTTDMMYDNTHVGVSSHWHPCVYQTLPFVFTLAWYGIVVFNVPLDTL